MPRNRKEGLEHLQYSDGDLVWVKLHNTEIWWPGEVTSSQDFRFVDSLRPPLAVVAFFNEKTYEQVKSTKCIYPFQCSQKEEFIKRGTKKADVMHLGDKFIDDVAIAEVRFQRDLESSSRPGSLIKALLSSSGSSNSSSSNYQNISDRSTGGQDSTFRIMDIGGSTASDQNRAACESSYECNMCSFRTGSISVLLIHRRAHMDTSSSYSSHSTSTNTSVSSFNPSRETRSARRATTTNTLDVLHFLDRKSRNSTQILNSVRCQSRHVSIVVDAPLSHEALEKVSSIAKMTLETIERVVQPNTTSSSMLTSTCTRNNRSSVSSLPKRKVAGAPRHSSQISRDPRGQRSNQLRATMPAPETPPSKQRRLTRSMSRRKLEEVSTPALLPVQPPPQPTTTTRGNSGRRRTLAVTVTERAGPSQQPATNSRRNGGRRCTMVAPVNEHAVPLPRRINPIRKTLTVAPPPNSVTPETLKTSKRVKRVNSRHIVPSQHATTIIDLSSPTQPAPATKKKLKLIAPDPKGENCQTQKHIAASLKLQLSLMAEWGDDETEDPPKEAEPSVDTNTKSVNRLLEPEKNVEQHEKLGHMSKRRIRNIPKKDRRDIVMQEFDTDSQLQTSDEPIVIQDSDASSNESVVFVEDEPRQRIKGLGQHSSSNSIEKIRSLTNSKRANISSCFDFEEEEEPTDRDKGLSYRRCTTRTDAKGTLVTEEPDAPNRYNESATTEASYDNPFKGFEDTHKLTKIPIKSIVEKESSRQFEEIIPPIGPLLADVMNRNVDVAKDVHRDGEADADVDTGDYASLPTKERQKRIFKSRNKSSLSTAKEVASGIPITFEKVGNVEDLSARHGEETLSIWRENTYSGNNVDAISNFGDSGNKHLKRSRSRSKVANKLHKKSKTELSHKQQWRSKVGSHLENFALAPEELSSNSSSTSSCSNSHSNTSCNSNQLSTSSSQINRSRAVSPGPSSSNSSSVASNIAVISAEEARELKRSATGAGLVHTSIVDATQPVQRGGVLILEDIRLPNLYEPFGLQSDSNDSRHSVSCERYKDEERSQDPLKRQAEVEVVNEKGKDHIEEISQKWLEKMPEYHEQVVEQNFQGQKHEGESSNSSALSTEYQDCDSPMEGKLRPQYREGLLKKCEQELLRRYKADRISGRTIEKCRKVRERWSKCVHPTGMGVETPQSNSPLEKAKNEKEKEVNKEPQSQSTKQLTDVRKEHNLSSLNTEHSNSQHVATVHSVLPSIISQTRRPASHPQINSLPPTSDILEASVSPSKSSGSLALALCDAVIKAHEQLENLRQQQRRRSTPVEESTTPNPASMSTPSIQSVSVSPPSSGSHQAVGQRRQRRRSRTMANNELLESNVVDESLCDLKDGQESLENPPQLCAGRICAVMTRPIPGYNHTFMLCSLANNNFTPLNNVALYLDSEKNHLVPVPREALLEPPRLADGHPLSAVFADIDFLGGEAVAQAVEPAETLTDVNITEDQVRLSPPPIVLSNAEDEGESVEPLGIMTPLSQVAEGSTGAGPCFTNEREELSHHHEDQMSGNVLQLNVNGHHLQLDPSVLFSIAEQPDSCIELNGVEVGAERAVLHARDILQAAQLYLQERDLQLVNLEDITLDEEEVDVNAAAASALEVPSTNLHGGASQVVDDSVAGFVGTTDAGVGLLHIDTRAPGSSGLLDVRPVDGETAGMVFISHSLPPQAAHVHLTPPITARTNETNALLDQTPIMSTLEHPSGVQLRRVSPLADGNLDDNLAVIGVTHGSGVPTSLELPITVTNPAIASRLAPLADIVQFANFQ
ncbi:hypothetical protein KR018_005222 [Drosophila ironensis]|nr:hypothetical protein KR018_005222 [Drosophila ironensis]